MNPNPTTGSVSSKARLDQQVGSDTNVDLFQAIEKFDLYYMRSIFQHNRKSNTPRETHPEAFATDTRRVDQLKCYVGTRSTIISPYKASGTRQCISNAPIPLPEGA